MYMERQNWLGYRIKDKCYNKLAKDAVNKERPQIIAVAQCSSIKIENPFTGDKYSKQDLGMIVVSFDIITVFIIVIFRYMLQNTQETYVDLFDRQSV